MIEEELCLKDFINNMKFQKNVILSILNQNQHTFLKKMSKIVIDESGKKKKEKKEDI